MKWSSDCIQISVASGDATPAIFQVRIASDLNVLLRTYSNLRYDNTVGRADNAIKNRWHSLKKSQPDQLPKV
jgi:hypothetical protein